MVEIRWESLTEDSTVVVIWAEILTAASTGALTGVRTGILLKESAEGTETLAESPTEIIIEGAMVSRKESRRSLCWRPRRGP